MNIKDLMPIIIEICTYFYREYYRRIHGTNEIVSDAAKAFLSQKIYNRYIYETCTEEVYDIQILDFPYYKIYVLSEDTLDISNIKMDINNFLDREDVIKKITTMPINVISLSRHPIENFISFNNLWIKWGLDFYKY